MTFTQLSLHPEILRAITEAGYSEPTTIQLRAIPPISAGSDIRGSAQTGTGKTAAFLLPALNHLMKAESSPGRGPRVLILAPTRELAMQIASQAEKYSKYLPGVKTVCVSGGVPYHVQAKKMARPYDILIATPGRLIDYLDRRKINLSRVEILVLDEADRMLDMGFVEPVEKIVAATPAERQTLLFSATFHGSVMKLSERLLKNPEEIMIHSEREKHDNIHQTIHYVDDLNHKNRLLDHILSDKDMGLAIVFTATKRHAEQLVGELHEKGFHAGALHGDMNQGQRTRTITQLKTGKINILVATDVAARGLDVQAITHVINFDLPHNVEDYVHRIGRTGRAGAKGTALSFAAGRDAMLVKRIEKYTGHPIDIVEIAGFEPRSKPRNSQSQQRPRSRMGVKRRFNEGGGSSNRRFSSGDKPSFNDSDRPSRSRFSGDKPSFKDGDRPSRSRFSGDKPSFKDGDRPSRSRFSPGDKPSFKDGDRPSRNRFSPGDKPSFKDGDRPSRSRFSTGDKPSFKDSGKPSKKRFADGERSSKKRFDASGSDSKKRFSKKKFS